MFKANLNKLKWSLVWVLHQEKCDPQRLTQILFAAEIHHLNLHGRPITGVRYYQGPPVICLEIDRLFGELNPIHKPLPKINTYHLSISDVQSLTTALKLPPIISPYLKNLPTGEVISYQEMITNPEVLAYLQENDSFSIVL